MERKKLVICLLLCVTVLTSCSNSDKFKVSQTNITLSKEKKTTAIQLNTTNWNIVGILNADGSAINGDIYQDVTRDEPTKRNVPLSLTESEEGMLKSNFQYNGFTVEKMRYSNTLQLILSENFSLHPFSFVIVLKSGNETQTITVTQEASNRYKYQSLTFSLQDGDGTSAPYWYDNVADEQTYKLASMVAQNVVLHPFDSTIFNKEAGSAKFVSDDAGAFSWISYDDSPLEIKVPWAITNGVIEYTPHSMNYDSTDKGFLNNVNGSITEKMSPGLNNYHFKYEMVKSQISYTLILVDVKTNEERQFKGKWMLIQPTGQFEFVRDK